MNIGGKQILHIVQAQYNSGNYHFDNIWIFMDFFYSNYVTWYV